MFLIKIKSITLYNPNNDRVGWINVTTRTKSFASNNHYTHSNHTESVIDCVNLLKVPHVISKHIYIVL